MSVQIDIFFAIPFFCNHMCPSFVWFLLKLIINADIFTFEREHKGGEDPNGFAPSFVEKPRIIPNEAGTLITMKCRCKSKPAPVVTWYREKDVVEESSRIKIKSSSTEEDIYELVLEIKVNYCEKESFIISISFQLIYFHWLGSRHSRRWHLSLSR